MSKSKKAESEPQDTKALNEEHEKVLIDAQWAHVKSSGILDAHPDSINSARPKE